METDRERDGWSGPVWKVVTERANFLEEAGKWVLGPRQMDFTTTYDRSGERLSESYGDGVILGSGMLDHTVSRRDCEGHIVERENFSDGVLLYRESLAYDSEGRKSAEVIYDPNGIIVGKTRFTYDARGKTAEMAKYGPDDTLITRIVYANEYDSEGNITRQTVKRWTNVDGEMVYDPLFIIYHVITYY
jgi:hypothetical protein